MGLVMAANNYTNDELVTLGLESDDDLTRELAMRLEAAEQILDGVTELMKKPAPPAGQRTLELP